MKVAIFGGTFDPIHRGHVEVAKAAADEFRLDRILFIPTGHPPHRSAPPEAAYEDRLHMVEIACCGDERFVASRLEAPRNNETHYSIDTIHKIKESNPKDELFFLIGADAFAEITQWHRWQEITSLVEFLVVSRPGQSIERESIPQGARVHWLMGVHVPISSTDIRKSLGQGRSADSWLPGDVASYIRQKRLYSSNEVP